MTELVAKYIQAIGTMLIGLSLLIGTGLGYRAWSGSTQPRTILVSGKASREITPSQSTISGIWQGKGTTADEARNKVKASASKGVDALKAAGVPEAKITTMQATVYPEYDYSSTGKAPAITGYQGSTTVQVILTDTAKADTIISTITKSGATSTAGPSFDLSRVVQDQIQKDLKVAAVTDAANQAKAIAEQAGGKLGEVIAISGGDLSSPVTPMPYYLSGSSMAEPAKDSTDLSTGQKELSVTVQVTYRLR